MCENYVTSSVAPQIASASACSSAFNVSSTLERTTASTCPRSSAVSTRIASLNPSAVSSAMVASLWSGTWFASQLPLNQIEAKTSNVRKLRYVIGRSADRVSFRLQQRVQRLLDARTHHRINVPAQLRGIDSNRVP